MKKTDLLADNPRRLFLRYLFPSISSTLVTSIYIFADTVIIGKGVGASGMAALNIVIPLFGLYFGAGVMLGVGGGVLMSVANGGGDTKRAKAYFTTAIVCGFFFSLLFTLAGILFFQPMMRLLGSDGADQKLIFDYGIWVVSGCSLFLFSSLLQAFVRNDRAPKHAMAAVITGGVLNMALDYLFVFPLQMGIKGAAIATLIGTAVTIGILLLHFVKKENTMYLDLRSFSIANAWAIIKNGFSGFLMEIANSIVILFFNLQLLKYIGEAGVVVYGIISNSVIIAMSLFNGVSQAAQPIMAANFGADHWDRVFCVRRMGMVTTGAFGVVIFLLGSLFPETAVHIFLNEPDQMVVDLAGSALRIYFPSFLFMSLNFFSTNYFQSVLLPQKALFISLSRGILLPIVLVFLLPILFDVTGIWATMPIAELIALLLVLLFLWKSDQKLKRERENETAVE